MGGFSEEDFKFSDAIYGKELKRQSELEMAKSRLSEMGVTRCNLRRVTATDALTSGRLAEQNGHPPDNPNSVLQLDHHDIMLGDPLEDCVSRYCIVHDHGLPFVWFPLGTDDSAP